MSKLLFFPEPFPDEDFRSVIYRYHIRTANDSFRLSNYELFGKKSLYNPMFPNSLEALFNNLPVNHSLDFKEIILNHTWYGLIKRFIDERKQKDYINAFRKEVDNPFYSSKKSHKRILSTKIKYCPKCIAKDIDKYGECYVHRMHQLEFLDFCPEHFIKLIDHCTVCDIELCHIDGIKLVSKPYCDKGHFLCRQIIKVDKNDSIVQFKLNLSKTICAIRDMDSLASSKKVYYKILMGLWTKDFIQFKGRVLNKKVITSMIDYYSIELIESINLPRAYICNSSFLVKYLKEDLEGDILFYCLLIQFLFGTTKKMEDFHTIIANPIPFGNGPWKCINSICKFYYKKVIRRCTRNPSSSAVSGEFSCPYCGYTYVCKWSPNKKMKKRAMIKSLGYLWEYKVLQLYIDGYSANEISKKLNWSHTTVKNYLTRVFGNYKSIKSDGERKFAIEITRSYMETASSIEVPIDRKYRYRKHIRDVLDYKNVSTRTELYKVASKEYNWLKMYDRNWLENNIPSSKNQIKRKLIKDISEFDKILSQKIEMIAKELYKSYPYQIRKYTIIKKLEPLEKSRIINMSDRLPISIKTLNIYIEDINDYLIRSLPRVKKMLRKNGYKITFNNLVSYSPLYRKCNIDTKRKVEMLLKDNHV